ncbi:type II toxin-antitoxin system HicB family antitoxin [Humisphaera borealis]|uniref:Ribbon-helix-helix protein CopG domain-containing protein n=1 Tax=Humisphaera borealis TaxID=2807512 RepID=A0A7M2WYQ8_9BACT|nr:hypothetical protein [Humisphaera borealis]QOV90657.1 hypothetical protein IPV69_04660 [Humisphaera borealis]
MSKQANPKTVRNLKPAVGDVVDIDAMTNPQKEQLFRDCEKVRPGEGEALTASQRALHARIRRKAGRPKIGKGAERINVTVERGLLSEADRFAKKMGITRAELIAVGLRRAIAG